MIGIIFADENEPKTFYKKLDKRMVDGGKPHFLHVMVIPISVCCRRGHQGFWRKEETRKGEDRQVHDLGVI